MGRNKGGRSKNTSDSKPDAASGSTSTAAAVSAPLASVPVASESAPGTSSNHEEEPHDNSMEDMENEKIGRSNDIEEEISKRRAAEEQVKALEERVKTLQAELQRSEQKAEEMSKKFESEREKFYRDGEASGYSAKGYDAPWDVTMAQKRYSDEESPRAIRDELRGFIEVPTTDPVLPSDCNPCGARFLLAECEYLLNKDDPVYNSLLAMADYADGGESLPSNMDAYICDAFDGQLTRVQAYMEGHKEVSKAKQCLLESSQKWERCIGRPGE
jgi:hypothetical protein